MVSISNVLSQTTFGKNAKSVQNIPSPLARSFSFNKKSDEFLAQWESLKGEIQQYNKAVADFNECSIFANDRKLLKQDIRKYQTIITDRIKMLDMQANKQNIDTRPFNEIMTFLNKCIQAEEKALLELTATLKQIVSPNDLNASRQNFEHLCNNYGVTILRKSEELHLAIDALLAASLEKVSKDQDLDTALDNVLSVTHDILQNNVSTQYSLDDILTKARKTQPSVNDETAPAIKLQAKIYTRLIDKLEERVKEKTKEIAEKKAQEKIELAGYKLI